MKFLIVITALVIVSTAGALPALAVFHDESGELIMALDDCGNLFELTREGWINVGDPCPGEGPYRIELQKLESVDDQIYILVFDGKGQLYQTDTSSWTTLVNPREGSVAPCLGHLISFTDSSLSVMILDAAGYLSFGSTDDSWQILSERIPSIPARDIIVYFDDSLQTLNPFILGADGRLCGYSNECWHSSVFIDIAVELNRVEARIDPETGDALLLAIDESGRIYDNVSTGKLALTEHEPCPGEGPWELTLNYSADGGFSLLCLDAYGSLCLANDGVWHLVTQAFPAIE